ncbi:MAG: outer membrane protein assembly factor BamD [Moraxella sp.]|nr:outer membrane protein assembly factor BamD [Moraxella sp.]
MNTSAKLLSISLISIGLTLTGCASVKGAVKKDKKEIITTAEKSEHDYYQSAQNALAKERYREAVVALTNIRTFYPTGRYAQQALLDLIYAQYQAKDYESVTASTAEFIRSYPTSRHADYALYVQGVTNMDGSPKSSRLIRLNQSERDTSYLRLAFNDFQNLVNQYPNSVYVPDAVQRMTALYNHFAYHELEAARWYIKRDAHVAAANRAKWVFQYFPQSDQVPEAIAILAHSNAKLGLTDTANEYKTLLQINYPQYLNSDGTVKVNSNLGLSYGKKALSALTFGKFGRAKDAQSYQGSYTGQTREQLINTANALQLPPSESVPTERPQPAQKPRTIGLGLPDNE